VRGIKMHSKRNREDWLTVTFTESVEKKVSFDAEISDWIERVAEEKVKEKLEEVFEKGLEAIRRKKTPEDVTYDTLIKKAWAMAGWPDDAGCDWFMKRAELTSLMRTGRCRTISGWLNWLRWRTSPGLGRMSGTR
jgi:hypothetical protein